ncbi:hypothetical protein HHL11_04350 [Ramlibacter sp. G-1-2-2]|uniref:Uncharacterized protein n=1 Tax=Ramlibacter agri TaxID=2728837 RepID=A0A848H1G2_9BURK|nr:hypothetical protein [Ramlibacter agri]NML42970.1 hypothetical protein [Ramlibacter agri]
MRIELPSPSWADVHRAQEDAHTLTVPEQRSPALDELLLAAGAEGTSSRIEVRAAAPRTLTLTL